MTIVPTSELIEGKDCIFNWDPIGSHKYLIYPRPLDTWDKWIRNY